jgi:hypothetical protein
MVYTVIKSISIVRPPPFSFTTVTVNSFNTALPPGSVLASFTANTTNTNTVDFTMSTLTPGKRYLVNVSGALVNTTYADIDGVIRFTRSNWPSGVFTVVEDASYVPTPLPTASPTPTVSPTPIQAQVSGDLNGDWNVDEKDVEIVNQHMGNVTSYPYPNYDVNQDGIVDVLDMQFVTDKIPLSLVDQVYNFLRSLI